MSRQEEDSIHAVKAEEGRYVYDLADLEQLPIGGHYSSGHGGIVEGERVQVALVRKKPGTGSRLHTHPNEQFNFVIKGELQVRVGEVEGLAGPGTLIHIPANVEHYTYATAKGDAEYYAVKDTSHAMYGEPVDGENSGPHFEAGHEPE